MWIKYFSKLDLLTEEWATVYFASFLIVLKALSCDWLAESCLGVKAFLKIPVLQSVGRGKTAVTVALPTGMFLVQRMQAMGLGNIMVKDQWNKTLTQAYGDLGNVNNRWGWWRKQWCPCEKRRVEQRESHF